MTSFDTHCRPETPRRTVSAARVLLAVLFCAVLTSPAAGADDDRLQMAGAYARLQQYGHDAGSNGWLAAVNAPADRSWMWVGEVSGTYHDGKSVHAFLGGARWADTHKRVTLFAQGLAGLSRVSDGYSANQLPLTGFTVQPGGGIDVTMTDRASLRVQFDYRLIFGRFDERDLARNSRFAFGIAYRFGAARTVR